MGNVISPFHKGEQQIQERLGVRDQMERFGRQVIRDHLPRQHQEFYQKLPYIFVGHADDQGWPWASILFGEPGFMSSPNDAHLNINAKPIAGDPLSKSMHEGLPLGLLGIELSTRRRNRTSGIVDKTTERGLSLAVEQTFGNCPQYIQARGMDLKDEADHPSVEKKELTSFDDQALDVIAASDTFFVASYVATDSGLASDGVDVSHRGGMPGFIRVDDDKTITIPDFLGNNHFNTLGNFSENPKAGLLFVDFESGDVLSLTGTVEILWDSPETQYFDGAQRLWTFTLDHGVWLKKGLPIVWQAPNFSVNSKLTGSWYMASKKRDAEKRRQAWMPHQVIKVDYESESIYSFYLKPEDGVIASFQAGQFLTLKVDVQGQERIRTYTVSSDPSDNYYRISVKRDGELSSFLHDNIAEGDVICIRAPAGNFVFETAVKRPAVLVAAGVGITPMVAMLRHALVDAVKTRYLRPITLIASARNQQERAFYYELSNIAEQSAGHINIVWCLSQPEDVEAAHSNSRGNQSELSYQYSKRIDKEILDACMQHNNVDVYLCGPPEFMQTSYDNLRSLDVSDAHIHAEAFGPASIQRNGVEGEIAFDETLIAQEALVSVIDAAGDVIMEQPWRKEDGNLLEFVESHGVVAAYGCRSGQCGACRAELKQGEVVYPSGDNALSSQQSKNQDVLLCCALPAAENNASHEQQSGDGVGLVSIVLSE